MRKIPQQLKDELASDPFMEKCCLYLLGGCNGRIEWHHNLIYAGKQQNKRWCILPLCHEHHLKADRTDIKKQLNKIMIERATPEDLLEYPNRNWKNV